MEVQGNVQQLSMTYVWKCKRTCSSKAWRMCGSARERTAWLRSQWTLTSHPTPPHPPTHPHTQNIHTRMASYWYWRHVSTFCWHALVASFFNIFQHLESFRIILIYLLNLFFVQFFPSFSIDLLVFPSPFCVVQVRCSLSAAMRYAIDAHDAVESGGRGLLCELATSSPMAHMPAVKELAAVGGTWEWRFPNSWGYPI